MSVTAVWRALLAALLVVCVLAPSSASASARLDRTEAGIVREMNKVRASHNLPRLRTNSGLARAADAHSATMLRTNSLEHGAFDQRVRRYVRFQRVGENLAWMSRCSPSSVVNMWMNSAGHRQIMLSRGFRRVGVAKRASSQSCFVTADFASSR
jgi:uncharacterized protein YkwD